MEEEKKEAVPVASSSKDKGKEKDKKDAEEDEMSPEDNALLEGLELAVTRTRDADPGIVSMALAHLGKEIRSSTTSMTAVSTKSITTICLSPASFDSF